CWPMHLGLRTSRRPPPNNSSVQHARRFAAFAEQRAVEPGSLEIGGDFSRQAAALCGGHLPIRFDDLDVRALAIALKPTRSSRAPQRLAVAFSRHDDRPPAVEHVSKGGGTCARFVVRAIVRQICRSGFAGWLRAYLWFDP